MDRNDADETISEQGRSAAVDVGADLSGGRRRAADGDGDGAAEPSGGYLGDGDTDDS